MDHQYSREEIELYVSKNLEIVGEARNDAESIRTQFADTIERLPPEEQVLLIEGRGANVTGERGNVQELFGTNERPVNGFYSSNPLSITDEFNKSTTYHDPIVWAVDARDNGRVTMRHEHGHRVDKHLGRDSPTGYSSDSSKNWSDALQREMELQIQKAGTPLRGANLLDRIKSIINRDVQDHAEPLYSGYRELKDHLSLYSDSSTHNRESRAEMSNHRNSLYDKFNGNEDMVNAALTRKYPELWPVYRDEVLPQIEARAVELIEQRNARIENYTNAQRGVSELAGQPFDAEQSAGEASKALLDGSYGEKMWEMREDLRIYNHPEREYLLQQERMHEARWNLENPDSPKSPPPYDEQAAMSRYQAIMQEQGLTGIKEAIVADQIQTNSMARFAWRFDDIADRLDMPVSDLLGGQSQAEKFDALYNEGGSDGVKSFMDGFVTHKQITQFDNEYTKMWDLRHPDKRFTVEDQRVLSQEIAALNNEGGGAAVSAKAYEIKEQAGALRTYVNAHENIDGILNRQLGGPEQYTPHDQLIEQFDARFAEAGMNGVLTDSLKMRVGYADVAEYIQSRESHYAANAQAGEDMSYYKRGGVYMAPPLSDADMPDNYNQMIRDDVKRLLEQGGEALLEETARLKMETHNVIGEAIGKPTPYPAPKIEVAAAPDVASAAPAAVAVAADVAPDISAGSDLSSHGPLGQMADALGKIGRHSDTITGAGLGLVAGGLAWAATGDVAQGGEVLYETAIPYGETQIDLARGDVDAAQRSAAIETTSIGGAIAGAAGGAIVGGPVGAIVGGIAGGVGGGAIAENLKPIENMTLEEVQGRIAGITDENYMDMSPETQSLHAFKDTPELFAEQFARLEEQGSLPHVTMDMQSIETPVEATYQPVMNVVPQVAYRM